LACAGNTASVYIMAVIDGGEDAPAEQTLYALLGVDEEATQEDIIRAYRQRALEQHPDKGGDKDDFDALNKAYATLNDDTRRRAYDLQLAKERERELLVEGGRSTFSKQQLQAPMPRIKTAPTPGSKRQAQMRTSQPGKPQCCAHEWKGMGSGKGLLKMLTDDVTAEERTQKLLDQYTSLPRNKEKRQEWTNGLRGKEKQDLKAAAKRKEEKERAKWSSWLSNGVAHAKSEVSAKAKAKTKPKAKAFVPKPRADPQKAAEELAADKLADLTLEAPDAAALAPSESSAA